MLLEEVRNVDERSVVADAREELQTDGQILRRKAARNADRRQAAKIPDASERIRET